MFSQYLKQWFTSNSLNFESALCNRIGGRTNLEDAAGFRLLTPAGGVWVVADGVGGQGAGELAAQMVVDTLLQAAERASCTPASCQSLLMVAHQAVQAARQSNTPTADMASTGVLLLSDGRYALWGHAGDSRLYHFRGNALRHRTEDQSVLNMLLARGALSPDAAADFAQKHVILQALGQDNPPEFCISQPVRLRSGDGFLLCSDGVWELASDEELLRCWRTANSAQAWLDQLETLITPRANGNADNFTALVVKVIKL